MSKSTLPAIHIASLTEVRGDGMEACVVDEYTNDNPLINIGSETILAGHLGSYVTIRQSDITILALVHKMTERDRADHKGRIYTARYISLVPVGEIQKSGVFVRGVRHYPTPGARV